MRQSLLLLLILPGGFGFSLSPEQKPTGTSPCTTTASATPAVGRLRTDPLVGKCRNLDDEHQLSPTPCSLSSTRRDALFTSASMIFGGIVSSSVFITTTPPPPANAATEEKTIWITGKAPQVPGQKPRDKSDVSGTKKDPSFLRSISDCKSQCENTLTADGLAKSKEDCLSECQDICCTTYEQCTFAIVPRI